MANQLETFKAQAVMVPFIPFGRDLTGWDCWGAIYYAYKSIKGIELPAYTGDYSSPTSHREIGLLIEKELSVWAKIEDPQPLDVVLIRLGTAMCHVGLVLNPPLMLHVASKVDTCIESFLSMRWNKRVVGVYRYVG